MKLSKTVFVIVPLLFAQIAMAQIQGWLPSQPSEKEIQQVVTAQAELYLEEEQSCHLEKIEFFEANYDLRDIKGNPVLLMTSEVETSGRSCKMDKYVECHSIFQNKNNTWVHDHTYCDYLDQVRD